MEASRLDIQQRIQEREERLELLRRLQEKLQQEINQLKWEDVQLVHAENHNQFPQELSLQRAGPETRAHFLQYSQKIHFDPNTAHTALLLSRENRKVAIKRHDKAPVPHPDRFTYWYQGLSRESLTGRHYWEVEWSGQGVLVAVAYKNISRAGSGSECILGFNDKSWAMKCDANCFVYWHDKACTPISAPWSSRVGVYLDHSAGVLSFYSVSGIMTLLHRVQTSFTQPLHAGVWLLGSSGVTAEFIEPDKSDFSSRTDRRKDSC